MITKIILNYFKFLAKLQLKKNAKAIIIGVTGSYGKTSTRLAIVQILKTRGIVKHSVHANSESGISLNILGLSPKNYSKLDWLRLILLAPFKLLINWEHFDYYVVEMGIDAPYTPKNMDYLLSILKPHISVVISAAATHTANFDHLVKDVSPQRRNDRLIELIAKEKIKLAYATNSQGTSVINIDNPILVKLLKPINSRLITYGKSTRASFRILNTSVSRDGFSTSFLYQATTYKLKLPDIFGPEYAHTFAAALAVGASLGIPVSRAIEALSNYRAPAGRLRLLTGIKNTHLIDSSYNSSPDTLFKSLTLLKQLGARNKKIAVLGDMNELGSLAKRSHQNLASQIRQNCDEVILFGNLTKTYTFPILKTSQFPVHHFDTMLDLIKYLKSTLNPNSWILFKGSQNGIFLERAVLALLAEKDDQKLLPRQGKYWDLIRHSTP